MPATQTPMIKINVPELLVMPATSENMALATKLMMAAQPVSHRWNDEYTKAFLVRDIHSSVKIEIAQFDVVDSIPVAETIDQPLLLEAAE